MGSDKGVVVRDLTTETWHYLYGPRWHPGASVTAIAAVPGLATAPDATSGVMLLGTDAGLAVVWVDDTFTLERKARWMAPVMKRHDRMGLEEEEEEEEEDLEEEEEGKEDLEDLEDLARFLLWFVVMVVTICAVARLRFLSCPFFKLFNS